MNTLDSSSIMSILYTFMVIISYYQQRMLINGVQVSTPNWKPLIAVDGSRFSARNTHASCVLNGSIVLTGGKTEVYFQYNLLTTQRIADVWYTQIAQNAKIKGDYFMSWQPSKEITGDYYIQNEDAKQPSSIAPWYSRYAHSLDSIDSDGDGVADLLVLMGGFSPLPSNDIWVSADSSHWMYCGEADWSPRAWHATAIFNNTLWLFGGSPLNNEVWYMDSITYVPQRRIPLTRSMYSNSTYQFTWQKITAASPWSPRVGHTVLNQYFWDSDAGETADDGRDRLLLVGGFGGFLEDDSRYDGFYCRSDVWESYDGTNWTIVNIAAAFGGRAWFAMEQMYNFSDERYDISQNEPARIFLIGGGNIGQTSTSMKKIVAIDGRLDAWWTRNGIEWYQISYQEGGGTTVVPIYSSQEWTVSTVDSQSTYLGMWGMTIEYINSPLYGPTLVLIGGDMTGAGPIVNNVYLSQSGIFCDLVGVPCSKNGVCGPGASGCICNAVDPAGTVYYTGMYCETNPLQADDDNSNPATASSASKSYRVVTYSYHYVTVAFILYIIVI